MDTADAAVRAALRGCFPATGRSTGPKPDAAPAPSGTRPRPHRPRCERCGGPLLGSYPTEISCLLCGEPTQEAYAAALLETGMVGRR